MMSLKKTTIIEIMSIGISSRSKEQKHKRRNKTMALDFTTLNATIATLTTQVTNTVGVEDSAEVLLNGFSAEIATAVSAALAAEDVTNQATLQAVNDAITGVTTQFATSSAALGTAVAANPAPTPVTPPVTPVVTHRSPTA
jgi:hypothetical protein